MQLCRRRVSHSRPPPPAAAATPRRRSSTKQRAVPRPATASARPRQGAGGGGGGGAPAAGEPHRQPLSSLAHSAGDSRRRAGGTAGWGDGRRAATHRRRWAPRPTPAGVRSRTHCGGSSGQGRSSRRARGLHWLKEETLPSLPLPRRRRRRLLGKRKKKKKESWAAVAGKSLLSHLPAPLSLPSPRQVRTRQRRQPGPAAQTLSACSGRWLPGLDPSGCFLSLHRREPLEGTPHLYETRPRKRENLCTAGKSAQ